MSEVDDVRLGRLLRALRRRRHLTQREIARSARLSQPLVSMVERGHLGGVSHDRLRRLFATVEARYEGEVSWRGGAIDRLLDERHAQLVGATAERMRGRGWNADLEITFNSFGDRGSIDVLATKPDLGVALVIEIKTELTSIEETIRRLDIKERLAPAIVLERYGWRPTTIGRLLVMYEGATNRRRVAAHAGALGASFPARGADVRSWVASPHGRLSGLVISSVITPRNPGRQSGGLSAAVPALFPARN